MQVFKPVLISFQSLVVPQKQSKLCEKFLFDLGQKFGAFFTFLGIASVNLTIPLVNNLQTLRQYFY